jgi:peptidoglycan/xylan/chitin deacetylase (PgdA/CDA1 family)
VRLLLLRGGKIEFYLICARLAFTPIKVQQEAVSEVMMRIVFVFFAALMMLGLVAFGVVVAQKPTDPVPLPAVAARVSPSQNTVAIAGSEKAPLHLAEATSAAAPFVPTAIAQNNTMAVAAAFPASASALKAIAACNNPDALGLSRVIEIDTTGGPAFGTEHFKQYDFLRDKEVVLTFDDGPWPGNTPMVLKALQDNCTKATFFEIGEHATWRPDLAKHLAAAGMTIGSHTWSHKDLAKNPYAKDDEQAKQEIEMGVSAVHMAVGGPTAPFFRFPELQQPRDAMAYLGTRNMAIFSTDIDTFDFKLRKPEDVVKSAMTKLAKNGKGILLMHDFQHATAEAMPELLRQLKAGGYKIVHMVPKEPVTTLAEYDDMVRARDKYSTINNARSESSIIKTISE